MLESSKIYENFSKEILYLLKTSVLTYMNQSGQEELEIARSKKIVKKISASAKDRSEHKKIALKDSDFVRSGMQVLDTRLGLKLQANSTFIYFCALFETFQVKFMKAILRENEDLRNRYKESFRTFAKSQYDKTGKDTFINMLINEEEMIENFDEIKDKTSLFVHLLNINIDDIWKNAVTEIIEHRERRNLFVHRGVMFDRKYEKTLKKNTSIKKLKNPENFLQEFKGYSKHTSKEQLKNGELDLSVDNDYLMRVHKNIYQVAEIIHYHAQLISKKRLEDGIGSQAINNFLIVHVCDLKKDSFSVVPLNSYLNAKKNLPNDDLSLVDDLVKINLCLCIDTLNKFNKKNKKINTQDEFYKIFNSISESPAKKLFSSYLENKYDAFLIALKEHKENSKGMVFFENWFMFKQLILDKEFKEKFNSSNL